MNFNKYLTQGASNRGAAAHKGAVKRYQGYRQILNLLPFKKKLPLGVPQIVILARQGCRQIFSVLQGGREPKKFEKHWFRSPHG